MNKKRKGTNAVFFLSTGRCATQFFADKLSQHYTDLVRVSHEPVRKHYQPPNYFSALHKGEEIELDYQLQEHIASIEETLKEMHYIETGWPSYGLLPYLIKYFQGRIKVVHLYRHPVKVAASLSTHNVYDRSGWSEDMSITPTDYGVKQSYLAGKMWSQMDDFSKCLFWWTEINSFALDLQKSFEDLPWHPLRFEDVFKNNGSLALEGLLGFLELPKRELFLNSSDDKVDRYSSKTTEEINIYKVKKFEETLKVMKQLGYNLADISENELNSRYTESIFSSLIGKITRRIKN